MDTSYSIFRSRTGTNVSAAAQSGSHITAPVLTNNTIKGNVHILHNAPGFTWYRPHSEKMQTSAIRSLIFIHKKRICTEYQYVTEYNSLPGERVLLSERFTQPLILQRHRDQKEREEELRSSGENLQQVLNSKSSHESSHLNSLFNPDDHGIRPSAVILQGNSGNGKTFTVQKIMMDWASGGLYKERFDIVFHLKCKEINRIPGIKSLVEILSYSCSLTSDQISQILQQSPEKVLFIIDGFDELRLTQDHNYMSLHTDLLQKAPTEVTLCALLKGHFLPESLLLVTTRSTATNNLSRLLKGPQRFTEIMGFSEKGVEEYFQKFFQDEELFKKAYECVRANETLITACSIPVICWIICTVMQERFSDCADVTSGLETTTSIYIDFVFTLLEHHSQGLSQSVPTLLRSLGQLAERGMLEQQVLLDEKTVYETVSDPAGSPFLCKFLFKRRISQETMFSFMHLSFQEFFTALYYISLDSKTLKKKLTNLHSSKARYEAVLPFLFGLLNKDVRGTLERKHGLFVHPTTQNHLKELLFKEYDYLLILHCLYELHEESIVKEVLNGKADISVMYHPLRRTDCWALLYCCQCCQSMKKLNLHFCSLSDKLSMILPVLHKFESVNLAEDLAFSDLVDLIHAVTRGRTLSSQSVEIFLPDTNHSFDRFDMSISEVLSRVDFGYMYPPLLEKPSMSSFSLSLLQSNLINMDWPNLFRALQTKNEDVIMFYISCLSGLKKMELHVGSLTESWAIRILSLSKNCPSLTEIRIVCDWILKEGGRVLQKSHTRPDCALTFEGYRCKTGEQCSYWNDCNERVEIHLNARVFSLEILRPSVDSL